MMTRSEELEALRVSKKVAFIDARVTKPGSLGHSYFYANPAVSSDLILLMRYHLGPGAENGRPLGTRAKGFWTIDDQYATPDNPAGPPGPPATRPVVAR